MLPASASLSFTRFRQTKHVLKAVNMAALSEHHHDSSSRIEQAGNRRRQQQGNGKEEARTNKYVHMRCQENAAI